MTKSKQPAVPAPPQHVGAGISPPEINNNVRIVDAKSGDEIVKVIEADADKGKVRRFDVQDGNLVRENDAFKVVDEDRAIRVEWRVPPAAEDAPE